MNWHPALPVAFLEEPWAPGSIAGKKHRDLFKSLSGFDNLYVKVEPKPFPYLLQSGQMMAFSSVRLPSHRALSHPNLMGLNVTS